MAKLKTFSCPNCGKPIRFTETAAAQTLGRKGGRSRSERKVAAARINAAKATASGRAGRPRKNKEEKIYHVESKCPACGTIWKYMTVLKKVYRQCSQCGHEWQEESQE